MQNIQRSRKEKKSVFKITLLILFILFLVLNYFKWQPLNSVILPLSKPLLEAKEIIYKPFSGFFDYFGSKKKLNEELENLKNENSNLRLQVLTNIIIESEYNDLIKQSTTSEIEIAKVILKPPFSSFDTMIISGNFDQSKIGQKVFFQNIILGEVVEVRKSSAIVKLYSASSNKTVAKLSDGNQFEVIGKGSGQYEIILPKDAVIKEGDPIIYPDENIVLFGAINKITSTDDELFQKVLFNIPVDFKDINFVTFSPILN
jgi:cell shape-determining protein MreC